LAKNIDKIINLILFISIPVMTFNCGNKNETKIKPGSICSIEDGKGKFGIIKGLVINDQEAHIKIYKNKYDKLRVSLRSLARLLPWLLKYSRICMESRIVNKRTRHKSLDEYKKIAQVSQVFMAALGKILLKTSIVAVKCRYPLCAIEIKKRTTINPNW
jgi:hypothetical protein